jgi:hypothetical protein
MKNLVETLGAIADGVVVGFLEMMNIIIWVSIIYLEMIW